MLTMILTVHLHSTILLPLGRCEAAEGGTVIKNSDLHKQVDEAKTDNLDQFACELKPLVVN